ncbi:MAG: mechanosensitive ion channel family protein [Treponema sp.]|jgi:small-conductance mechanosensitive channel|nr:mechanosensitive ion channel family protein [Treponema sp.]
MEQDELPALTEAIEQTLTERSVMPFAQKLSIAAGIIAGQILLMWIVWLIFKKTSDKITNNAGSRIKPLVIKNLRLLTSRQITNVILFFLKILKYIITVFQLFITIPIVFSLFPATENLASTIFGYILNPLKNIAFSIIKYIPNLITIIIILLITKYVIKGLKFFSVQIAREKLKLPGFYPEWAQPTFNILRFMLYAFTVAIVYPYLPGSESRIFQGVSVFVGLIFSFGSSSAIGNLVAGIIITYMRSFKIGDRIQIHNNVGFVVEKSIMVLRIKTSKNEYITIPNLQVLQASIINYNTSSDEDEEGLVLHADITFAYSTPWRLIHEILIEAALKTRHVLKTPKPFVLQTALDDFYARYQINCYTKKIDNMPAIYSELYANLQDGFASRGLDMTAPHFRTNLPPGEEALWKPPEEEPDEKKGKKDKEEA